MCSVLLYSGSCVFFFKQKTAYELRISDWSSDVCSSDLLRAHLGSAFSLEPTLTQSAFFRTHNRDDMIHNLYFVGAGTHPGAGIPSVVARSEEHTSELQSLMRISYAVFCLKKKNKSAETYNNIRRSKQDRR